MRMAIYKRLGLIKVEDLDFGSILETGTGGTVVMTPTPNASCAVTGSLTHYGECQPAVFGGAGTDGAIIRIKKPPGAKLKLVGPGVDMNVTDFTIDGSPELITLTSTPGYSRYRIDSPTGIFTFRVGATLNVNANQLPGLYTGNFIVVVDYN